MYHLYGNFAFYVRHFFPRVSGSSVRFLSILSYSLAFFVLFGSRVFNAKKS